MPANHHKTKLFITAGILVLLVVVISAAYIMRGLNRVTTDDAYIVGRIHSIAAKVPGTVKQIYIDDNQDVKAGQMLLTLDPADYDVRLAQAQAALDAERARLADASANIRAQAANLDIQRVSLHQAMRDKARADTLFKEEVITKERYEKVATAYNLAVTQLKAASELLARARAIESLEQSLIKQDEAAVKIAELNLGYTTIAAPAGGYVTGKSVEVGNQIQAGQPLMAVVALDDIWIVANFKETQLKNVRPGQRVIIKVDTYPGKVFTGKIDSVMAATGAAFFFVSPENALGNYVKVVQRIPVKIVFDTDTDIRHLLRIGMSCIPTIVTVNE